MDQHKPEAQKLKNAYTDAPVLHPNLVVSSWQLVVWFLFHPTAWRNHVARFDATLPSHFPLTQLSRAQWRTPTIRQLLIIGYLLWPLMAGLFAWGWLWLWDPVQAHPAQTAAGLVIGGLTFGLIIGLGASAAAGMVGGPVFIIGSSLSLGPILRVLAGPTPSIGLGPLLFGFGIVPGLITGSLARLIINVAAETGEVAWRQQIVYIGLGVLVGLGAIGITAASLFESMWLLQLFNHAPPVRVGVSLGLGLAVSLALGGAIRQRWPRARRKWSVQVTVALICVGVFDLTLLRLTGGPTGAETSWVALGVTLGVLTGALFVLPYVIANRLGNLWSGVIAAALTSGGSWTVGPLLLAWLGQINIDADPAWPLVILGVGSLLLGLTLPWWQPFLSYHASLIWNILFVYSLDEQRDRDRPSLLRRHSAFWDEFQRLKLYGLNEHLVLVAERSPAEGQAALTYLSDKPQRWAAQQAQVELDTRRLERAVDVEAIGNAHRGMLVANSPNGFSSLPLRSFHRLSQDIEAALNQASAYNRRLALNVIEDRLDGLLRELTRSSEAEAVRFRRIAGRWRQLIADHIHDLITTVEARQEIESPYVIGMPLTEQQEIFIGRTDISAQIEQLLLDRRRPPLLLYGQRRMGKTSLLNNLGRLLPSTIVPFFVDLQGPASRARDYTSFLYNIARGMSDSAVRRRELALPPLPREALAADPFTRFDEWLDEVVKTLGERTALLALDEFEALDNAISRGRFDEEDVLGMLRHLIQHRPRIKVLLAGSHTLDELQRWASYLINVQVIPINYLTKEEAYKLIEQPVEGFALRYKPEASHRILELTRGHPFLVQLLCAEIIVLKNEQDPAVRRLAHLSDVEMAVPEALNSGSFFFSDIEHNQIDSTGLTLLRYIAAQGEGAMVQQRTLAGQVSDQTQLDQTLTRLAQRELIETVNGGYRFQVEMIRRWFEQAE